MLYSVEGVPYDEKPIDADCEIRPGDEFVFVCPVNRFRKISNRIVNVTGVSVGGFIITRELKYTVINRKDLHEIIRKEVDLSGFDEIFT